MAQRPTSRAAGTVKRTPKAAPGAPTKKAATAKAAKTKASAAKAAPKVDATKISAAKAVAAKSTAAETVKPKTKAAGSPSKAPKTAAAKTAPGKTALAKTKYATPAGKPAATKAAAPRKASKPAKTTKPKTPRPAKTPKQPPYLAAELGQPTDQKGEPVGAGQALVRSDAPLQDYTLQLWRQMQSGRVVHRYMRTIERAGLTVDEVWTAGLSDIRATSSTPDEMQRYRQKVLFRANLLEAILSETVADLRRLDGIEPTPPKTAPEPG